MWRYRTGTIRGRRRRTCSRWGRTFDVGLQIALVARETRGFARGLDALLSQVTCHALRERRVEAVRPGVDEVRADEDRALELEAKRRVASRARRLEGRGPTGDQAPRCTMGGMVLAGAFGLGDQIAWAGRVLEGAHERLRPRLEHPGVGGVAVPTLAHNGDATVLRPHACQHRMSAAPINACVSTDRTCQLRTPQVAAIGLDCIEGAAEREPVAPLGSDTFTKPAIEGCVGKQLRREGAGPRGTAHAIQHHAGHGLARRHHCWIIWHEMSVQHVQQPEVLADRSNHASVIETLDAHLFQVTTLP
jgi:hypothetical protein